MRKLFLILILGVLSINLALGQKDNKVSFQFNLASNLSIPYDNKIFFEPCYSRISDQDNYLYTDFSSQWGYLVEALLDININKHFSILTGLNYNANRIKVNYEHEPYRIDAIMYSSYINIPLFLKYKIHKVPQLSISGGVFLGFHIKTYERMEFKTKEGYSPITDGYYFFKKEYQYILSDNYTKVNYGVMLQTDYEYQLSRKLTGIVFCRFNYGLKNTIKTNQDHSNLNRNMEKWRIYDLAFGLGLKI